MNILKDKLQNVNKAWHELTDTNNVVETLKEKAASVDSLLVNKLDKLHSYIEKQQDEINSLKTALSRPSSEKKSERIISSKDMEYKSAFCNYLRRGSDHALANMEYKSSTLSGNNGDIGYSITTRMSEQIADLMSDSSIMRKIATVDEISTDSLELIEDRDSTESGWSQEGADSLDSYKAINPSRKIITVHELYAQPKVTQKLLDDPRIDIEQWISKKLIDVFARKESEAFIKGDGQGKPMGILSYENGKEWGKIEQIQSAESITSEAIISLFFSLKEIYSNNAKFLMSRSAIRAVRMLKDQNNGRYLWTPSMDVANPNTILGAEVIESPDMPEVKSGNIPIALADFKRAYQIVDRPGIKVLRDPYTGKPYVKYYALKRVGADVVNFDAIKLLAVK